MNLEQIIEDLGNKRTVVVPVDSSNIATMGYNPNSKELSILFVKGFLYRYTDVDIDTFMYVLMSDSKGKAFHNKIRNNFNFIKYKSNGAIDKVG